MIMDHVCAVPARYVQNYKHRNGLRCKDSRMAKNREAR